MDKSQMLTLLNEDLALEYSAALQYTQHAAMLTGAQYDSVRAHLLVHAEQEMAHAYLLSERIAYMGGVPTALPSLPSIRVADRSSYMLALDLEGEREAVSRYKQRVYQAHFIGEPGLALLLSSILKEEEEHEDDLVNALGVPAGAAQGIIRLAGMAHRRASLLGGPSLEKSALGALSF